MFKKLHILILLLFAFSLQAAAQYSHVEFSYQSFRPFLHFQLDFDSRGYGYHDSYETAYLKGYMDGVNESYYYNHRFADLVRDQRIYEAGYRDGLRDHRLMIRLRGRAWYNKHRFRYDDYYAPSYSVRIWLDGLSLAFLQAPAHRLPKHWKYRAHPHFIEYRKWYSNKHHYKKKYGGYHRFDDVERRFQKRIRDHRKKAVRHKKRVRKNASYSRSQRADVRFRNNRGGNSGKRGVFKRSNERKRKSIQSRGKDNDRRRTFRGNRGNDRRKSVDKSNKRKRSRGAVIKKRGGKKEKSKRSRSRSRSKRDNGNK